MTKKQTIQKLLVGILLAVPAVLVAEVSANPSAGVKADVPHGGITVTFDARGAGLKPEYETLKSWGGRSPDGRVLRANNYFLEMDGKPLPLVLGEIHPQRYPAEYWEEAILAMKAAGLNGISIYVFWNQIEPRPGEFDFSGRNNLRSFIDLCAKHGMYSWLRVGPFCNAEILLGGLPPWLYGMPLTERSNQPRYLELVGRYYAKLGEHLKGTLWQQGGPVIGVQLENELGVAGVSWERVFPQFINKSGFTGLKDAAFSDHYRNLKKLAVKGGLNAPFFSCTGWGLNESKPIPYDEIMPTELGYMGGHYYHKGKDKNWVTLFDDTTHVLKSYWGKCPVGLSEIGTGLPMTQIDQGKGFLPPEITSGAALTRVGSMPTIYAGYYMFHGGSNPIDPTCGWAIKAEDKYPQVNYDFQAPLGEFGDWRPSLFHLRPFNLFLASYGAELSRTEVRQPADPVVKSDDDRLRTVARMGGNSGFLFFNNYGCVLNLSPRPDTRFEVQTDGGLVTLPRVVKLDIPRSAMGVLPINLDMGGGAKLLSATVQPVCRFGRDGKTWHIFSQLNGMPCELVLGKDVKVEATGTGVSKDATPQPDGAQVFSVKPGRDAALTLKAPDATPLTLVVLSQEDARKLAVFKQGKETLLVLSDSPVTCDGKQLKVMSRTPLMEVGLFPALPKAANAQQDGLFQKLSLSVPARTIESKIEKFAPNKWVLKVPAKAFEGLDDIYLDLSYAGQGCRIFDIATGLMVADQFNLGVPWRVGLKRFQSQLAGKGLFVRAEPDNAAVALPGNPEVVMGVAETPQAAKSGPQAQLREAKFVPEYSATIPLN